MKTLTGYDPLEGVPNGSYYLQEKDFSLTDEGEDVRIIWHAKDKQELIDICKDANLPCPDLGTANGKGYEYHILYCER